MFFKRKVEKKSYDKKNLRPVIRCSICTGEQVAGFKDIHTGQFQEVMLITDSKDMETFMKMYDLKEVTKEY